MPCNTHTHTRLKTEEESHRQRAQEIDQALVAEAGPSVAAAAGTTALAAVATVAEKYRQVHVENLLKEEQQKLDSVEQMTESPEQKC